MKEQPKAVAVLADPPWRGVGAEHVYDTMNLTAIKAMPVADLVLPDAWCFVWIPNSLLLDEGAAVLRAWGFEPAPQLITWTKFALGTGRPLRNTTEQLLVGRRGKPEAHFRGQPTHLIAPRGRHSEKPAEQYAVVERLVGNDGVLLELFARRRPSSSRWLIWGSEAEGGSDFEVPGYPVENLRKETRS
jgi:N6-adenosine-specific RNA methylase IME4